MLALAGTGAVLAQGQGSHGDQLPPRSTQSQPDAAQFKTMDDLLAEVGTRVPGFGGMYLDPSDNNIMYVYLLDDSQEAAAAEAIKDVSAPNVSLRVGLRRSRGSTA